MAGKKPEKKLCFVVGPIGDDDSEDRIHADWLLEEIILPVFADFQEFEVKRADKISNPGRIDAQVITALLDAELVIADLTSLNPNAFYEIGIRHTAQKPVIHMHLEGQRIPFDIAPFRSIPFQRKRPKDLRTAREALKLFVAEAIDDEHQVDNPVTFARGKLKLAETATPGEKVVLAQVTALERRMAGMESALTGGAMGTRIVPVSNVTTLVLSKGEDQPEAVFNDFINTEIARRCTPLQSTYSTSKNTVLVDVGGLSSGDTFRDLVRAAERAGLNLARHRTRPNKQTY